MQVPVCSLVAGVSTTVPELIVAEPLVFHPSGGAETLAERGTRDGAADAVAAGWAGFAVNRASRKPPGPKRTRPIRMPTRTPTSIRPPRRGPGAIAGADQVGGAGVAGGHGTAPAPAPDQGLADTGCTAGGAGGGGLKTGAVSISCAGVSGSPVAGGAGSTRDGAKGKASTGAGPAPVRGAQGAASGGCAGGGGRAGGGGAGGGGAGGGG